MSYSGQMIRGTDNREYYKLLSYCAEIVKANIARFKDAPLSEIKASIETELEIYKEVEK